MAQQVTPVRHYGLDWLRIAAFGLLILYHLGKYFSVDAWLVHPQAPVPWVSWPMLALEPWRLALLFVVSGYASHALLARCGGIAAFLKARSHRLLLPLGFGLLVLAPPQTWIGLVENHGYQGGFLHFWSSRWLSFGEVDGVAVPNGEHLWFIGYLWTYTMALGAALAAAPPNWREWLRRTGERVLERPLLLALPLAAFLLLRVLLLFTIPETHGLLHDWVSDLTYAPAFLFGFALAASPAMWPAILRLRRPALLLAGAGLALLFAIQLLYPGERTHVAQALDRDGSLVMAWSMILLLLGAAHQWLNRDHRWRARLSEAVFPFYLAHQPIIVLVGWRLSDSGLPALALFAILAVTTLAGCWLFFLAGRGIRWLRPFVGLSPATRRRPLVLRPATGSP